MKTLYMYKLNGIIEESNKVLDEAGKSLAAAKKELWFWMPGHARHEAALAAKVELDAKVRDAKKRIAWAERMKKHPEVLRRNRISDTVERIAEYGMDLKKANVVICQVNDAPGGKVNAETEKEKDWNYYAKSCKFPKIEHNVVITVNPDWDKQVEARGLEFLGGMLTLSVIPAHRGRNRKALELAAKHDIDLFEAAWMRKGRGFQVFTEIGFIAVKRTSLGLIPSTAYHSESAMAAVEGSHRKFQNIDDLPLDIRDVPDDAVATWDDAEAVGACAPGVRSWCNIVGIDHTQASVPLIDVVRGYYMKPAPEAKAIILRVLRACPHKSA